MLNALTMKRFYTRNSKGVKYIIPFVSRPGAGSCRRCGYSESLHLLRDAYRALRKLTLITVAQEPAGAGDDLTVTIHKAGK